MYYGFIILCVLMQFRADKRALGQNPRSFGGGSEQIAPCSTIGRLCSPPKQFFVSHPSTVPLWIMLLPSLYA